MAKRLFRKNQEEFGTSPDQLQDYVRVTNPLVWMILVAVLLLLGGGVVAATLGKVEVTMNASAYVEAKIAHIDIATPDAFKIKTGMTVRFAEYSKEVKIEDIQWISEDLAEATFTVDLPDATKTPYPCIVVTDIVSPISFLIN